MTAHILETSMDLIGEITKDNIRDHILKKRVPLAIMWIDSSLDNKDSYKEMLRRVAPRYSAKLAFFWAEGPSNLVQVRNFGLSGNTFPAVTILDPKNFVDYGYEGSQAISKETLTSWFAEYIAGTLLPNMRKESSPEISNGVVTALTYDTFKTEVIEPKRDAVVMFYVEDDNCLRIMSAYEKLASAMSSANILFGKINLDKNDVPRHGIHSVITGYPTIKFFFENKRKSPEIFQEKVITIHGLIDWIHSHASVKFDKEASMEAVQGDHSDIKLEFRAANAHEEL